MFFETELSDKLNNELESAGICVSEDLIAKTLVAVQAARTATENEASDAEWIEAAEGNATKLIELAGARKRRIKSIAPVLFRAATVMAACFVLVVGAFALRFSTMRMGKDSAAQEPMMTAENGSARNSIAYAADADSMEIVTGEEFSLFDAKAESPTEQSAASGVWAVETAMEPIEPTAESDMADDAVANEAAATEAVEQEPVRAEDSDVQSKVAALTEILALAESVELRKNEQGIRLYEFFAKDSAGAEGYYCIYEDGSVEFAEVPPEGQTNPLKPFAGSDDKAFRRAVLVWMKEHGYSF